MEKIISQRRKKSKVKVISKKVMSSMPEKAKTINGKVELIQMLIPLGLRAINDLLQEEVAILTGKKYHHDGGPYRWGNQAGSVYLGEEKFRIEVPRVRDLTNNKELPLESYQQLRERQQLDEKVFKKVLLGLSCSHYKEVSESIPEAFGMSRSTVSRRFVKASAKKLEQLLKRSLATEDFNAIFIDGKSFSREQMIVAVGVTMMGEKKILGVIQAVGENERVCQEFLESLVDRGLDYRQGLLCIVDGSKGLLKAIRNVFSGRVLIQRCQWHKRENIVSYLPKGLQEEFRRKLNHAYHIANYNEAKKEFVKIKKELSIINESAVASLEEGLEETLTLQRLGLFEKLGDSFKTTNVIESINSRIAEYTDKVDYWKNSNQKLRWTASALLDIEPRLRRVKGMKALPELRRAIQQELHITLNPDAVTDTPAESEEEKEGKIAA